MIPPHVEACECLARLFDPAHILPTDTGGWGEQDGRRVTLLYSERDALTDWAWQAIAYFRGRSSCASAHTSAGAMDKALRKLEA